MQRRLFAHKTNAPAAHKSPARLQARLRARAGLLESRSRRSGMGGLQAWLANGWIQAKLEVSQPGDRSEEEADRVADQVMTAPESEEREPTGKDTVAELNRLRASGGESLAKREQAFFGSRFGRDISGVRIYQGPAADRLARALNAKAFTIDQDIVFREGEYSPDTHAGKKLLAHEITHTVQQSGGERVQRETKEPRAPAAEKQDDTDYKNLWDRDLHEEFGIYYTFEYRRKSADANGETQSRSGWLLDARQLRGVIAGLDRDFLITRFEISAHHRDGMFYGKKSAGVLSDAAFAGLFGPQNVARGAHFQIEACNSDTLRMHLRRKLRGLGVTWTYTIGTNTDVPGVPWDIPESWMQEQDKRRSSPRQPRDIGREITESLDG